METSRAVPATKKAEQTRERIVEVALRLFTSKGYEATTMRDIAAEAGCSLGLAYRYFARKEDLVMVLYLRLAQQLERQLADLPPAPLADRFERAMRAKLALLEPYRPALGALFSVSLNPQTDLGVLSPATGEIRDRVTAVYLMAVSGATDAPKPQQAGELATILYTLHLLFILFWLSDRTPEQRATYELLGIARDLLNTLRPALRLPPVARLLSRLARALLPVFSKGM